MKAIIPIEGTKGIDVKKLAVFMHETYEQLSKEEGWETHKKCQTKFDDLPEENKKVMLQLSALVIQYISEHQEDI